QSCWIQCGCESSKWCHRGDWNLCWRDDEGFRVGLYSHTRKYKGVWTDGSTSHHGGHWCYPGGLLLFKLTRSQHVSAWSCLSDRWHLCMEYHKVSCHVTFSSRQ